MVGYREWPFPHRYGWYTSRQSVWFVYQVHLHNNTPLYTTIVSFPRRIYLYTHTK